MQLSLRPQAGSWADGAYTFVFTTPESVHTCQLALPGELPTTPGPLRELTCSPALGTLGGALLNPASACREERAANAVSENCQPLPGQFVLEVQFVGTPATLSVHVERSGTVLLDDKQTLRYTEERPNGPGCEPVCRQTRLALTLP